jgi:hypothetical protein
LSSYAFRQIQDIGWTLCEKSFDFEIISDLKDMVISCLNDEGLICDNGTFNDFFRNEFYEGSDLFNKTYLRIQKKKLLHEFKHSVQVKSVFEKLLNSDDIYVHPNITVRICPPFDGITDHSTVSHQDYFNIQGSKNTLTLWIPLDDYKLEDGVLAVSDRQGDQILDIEIDPISCKPRIANDNRFNWHSMKYHAGDAMAFDALTPHKALQNSGNLIRISIDIRAQKASEKICESSLLPVGMGVDTFDEFSDKNFQGIDIVGNTEKLNVTSRDRKLDSIKYELMFQEAEKGNSNMKALLQRICSFSHDKSYRERARQYLKMDTFQ